MVQSGSNINIRDEDGRTPLIHAWFTNARTNVARIFILLSLIPSAILFIFFSFFFSFGYGYRP
ncbi:hypothetical protein [Fictibacillus barbaricus]|uniref:hypothetical protein n=1 Tax=Fictibacillus barbaricus TaxID=182136 RepID=UPI0035A225BF